MDLRPRDFVPSFVFAPLAEDTSRLVFGGGHEVRIVRVPVQVANFVEMAGESQLSGPVLIEIPFVHASVVGVRDNRVVGDEFGAEEGMLAASNFS